MNIFPAVKMKRANSITNSSLKQQKLSHPFLSLNETSEFPSEPCASNICKTEESFDATEENSSSYASNLCAAILTEGPEMSDDAKEYSSTCVKPNPVKGKRKFQNSWLTQMKWLHYDAKTNIARCTTCSSFSEVSDQTSRIVQGFSGPFKLESFKKHENSNHHIRCCAALEGKLLPEPSSSVKSSLKASEKLCSHLKVVFNCSYYIAKRGRHFSDLEELMVLTRKCNASTLQLYNNSNACQEIVHSIAATLESDLITDLRKSSTLSLLLDSSLDILGEEQVILCVRYLRGSKIEESFLSLFPPESAFADGYVSALQKHLHSLNLSELLSGERLVGICTDGAASMSDEQNGTVKRLSKFDGLSHLVGVHCIVDKLNSAVLNSVEDIKYLEEFDHILDELCNFYRISPTRMRELQTVSKDLEYELRKPLYVNAVRWINNEMGAISVLVEDWKCVVLHLEDTAKKEGEESAMAQDILMKLKSFRFVITIHFLQDFLEILLPLSLTFQKKDLSISLVDCHIKRSVESLVLLKEQPGKMEDKVISNTSLKGVFQGILLNGIGESVHKAFSCDREQLIAGAVQNLNERFASSDDLSFATSIFDTFSWPSTENDLEEFGNEEVKLLAIHYEKYLELGEEDVKIISEILGEWSDFKVLGQKSSPEDLLDSAMCNRFPLLSKLFRVVSVLPTSTASCKRCFNELNSIKDRFSSLLETESLNDLMMINLNGPDLEDFNPTSSVEQWYSKEPRHVDDNAL